MNEDDILAQLRDIHLPADLNASTAAEFALWPFAVLGAIVLIVLAIRLRNRGRWRRQAQADLTRILSTDEQTTQWHKLLEFADGLSRRAGRAITLPNTAYQRPETISDEERAEFVAFLRAELHR